MTYTYVILQVPKEVYLCIKQKLIAEGYSSAIETDGTLDMHGLALAPIEPSASQSPGTGSVIPLSKVSRLSPPEDLPPAA